MDEAPARKSQVTTFPGNILAGSEAGPMLESVKTPAKIARYFEAAFTSLAEFTNWIVTAASRAVRQEPPPSKRRPFHRRRSASSQMQKPKPSSTVEA